MSKLLRYPNSGGVYFITCVTDQRKPILVDNFNILKAAYFRTMRNTPVKLLAYSVLSDHLHFLVDVGIYDISSVMRRFKSCFAALYQRKHECQTRRIWQSRFWDHIIRDQNDLNQHLDYICYNPVKHGYTNDPHQWPYSSINWHGDSYPSDWGMNSRIDSDDAQFGE